jgi:hypothetical protein
MFIAWNSGCLGLPGHRAHTAMTMNHCDPKHQDLKAVGPTQAPLCRRRLLVAALLLAPAARAHHGFTGIYDYDRPVLVAGAVVSGHIGYPHGHIMIRSDPAQPADAAFLQEVSRVEARDLSPLLTAVDVGPHRVVLDPPMTRALMAHAASPKPGDAVQAIAYRRSSSDADAGELRVLHLRLRDGTAIAGQRRSYHRSARD